MDLSQELNQEELSDLVLHFSVELLGDSSRKRPRSEWEAAYARSFFVHKLVLYQSPYFKALLQRWKSDAAPTAGASISADASASPPPAASTRMELVEHVEEGELDAVELLLKCMYKVGIPEEAHGNVRLLLQVYRLADKYEPPAGCMEPIIAALSAIKAKDMDIPVITHVYSMLEGRFDAPSLAPLFASCQLRLVALFGDVPSVITTAGLRQQFCALPHAAVLAWLKANNLKVNSESSVVFLLSACIVLLTVRTVLALYLQVHSESCVLFLLSAWVNNEERPECSAQQMEQLVHNVRVQHLSLAYLQCVLPDLIWFRDHSAGMEKFLRAVIMKRTLPPASPVPSFGNWTGPPAWIAAKRLRSQMPTSTAVTMDLGLDGIQLLDSSASMHNYGICSSVVFLNGVGFVLRAYRSEVKGASRVKLALLLEVDKKYMATALGFWGESQPIVIGAELWAGPKVSTSKPIIGHRIVCITSNILDGSSAATIAEVVAPFLVDGRLTLKAVITRA